MVPLGPARCPGFATGMGIELPGPPVPGVTKEVMAAKE